MLRTANRYPRPMQPLQPLSPIELTRKVRQHDDDLLALYELVERLEDKVDAGFEQVDARFEQVDARLEQVDTQLGASGPSSRRWTGSSTCCYSVWRSARPSRAVSAVTQIG